jgi:hypothetical protein
MPFPFNYFYETPDSRARHCSENLRFPSLPGRCVTPPFGKGGSGGIVLRNFLIGVWTVNIHGVCTLFPAAAALPIPNSSFVRVCILSI